MGKVKVIEASKQSRRQRNSFIENQLRVAAYCRVSTDSDEQKLSYQSQVLHYKQLVETKPEWELVDIYADEAISGTQINKRVDFQRMINDALEGKIDMIITKSISRFARNTLDTLKYVRLLKEKNVAIMFEKENINTLTMNGEMLLVILSSLAQQESESISANVTMGLKMKMKRGEMVGYNDCLGYDYDSETKTISINEEEAGIVRYIFRRYVEGSGCFVIAKEVSNLGYKTRRGSTKWHEGTVRGIIKNEKYKGDLLQGKTFTVDPITHRRLDNMGEKEQFYDVEDYLPCIERPIEEIMNEINLITNREIISKQCKALNDYFFNNSDFLNKFKKGIGGVSQHHNYRGGLAEHTLNVMYLSTVLAERYECNNREIAVLGAKLHDIGKMEELFVDGPFSYTLRGEIEGHIVIGVSMLEEAFKAKPDLYNEDFKERIKGCIIQHHGKMEYGSPRQLNMEETFIVHYADYIDATMNKISQIKKDVPPGTWSEYDRRIGTKLYL